jgi:hypothetical protein
MRFLAVVPLLVALVLPAPAAAAGRRDELAASLEVLHSWDAGRAEAWAASDVEALRSLYVHGSDAGRADVHLLRVYQAHGTVVRRLVTQVFAASLLRRDPTSIRLRVFDRVAGGEVVRSGHTVRLASTPPALRTIDLRRVSGHWRVESVSGSG